MEAGLLKADEFLTEQTSEGLRMTIQSTIELSKVLLQTYKFEYVLTGRINQDPLEVFVKETFTNFKQQNQRFIIIA